MVICYRLFVYSPPPESGGARAPLLHLLGALRARPRRVVDDLAEAGLFVTCVYMLVQKNSSLLIAYFFQTCNLFII